MRTLSLAFLALILLLAACVPAQRNIGGDAAQTMRIKLEPLIFEFVPAQTSLGKFNPPGAGSVINLTAGLSVSNPNELPLRLDTIDYQLFLGEQAAVSSTLLPAITLAPGATQQLSLKESISLQNNPDLVRAVSQAFTGVAVPLRLEGRVSLSAESIVQRLRHETVVSGEVYASETVAPPLLRLDEMQSGAFLLEPGVPVLRAAIRLSNPGDIGYFLYGTDLLLLLGGQPLVYGDMMPVPVPAKGTGRAELLFYPDVERLSSQARDALAAAFEGIPTSLEVQGNLSMDVLGVGTFEVPPDWEVFGFVSALDQ